MKSILLSLVTLLAVGTNNLSNPTNLGPEYLPTTFWGIWENQSGEKLIMEDLDGGLHYEYERLNSETKEVVSAGVISSKKGKIHVERSDIKSKYDLSYAVYGGTLVVENPNSNQVWIFTKKSGPVY